MVPGYDWPSALMLHSSQCGPFMQTPAKAKRSMSRVLDQVSFARN